MSGPEFFDEEERDLIAAYERNEFKPVEPQEAVRKEVAEAVRRYLRKDARINIRLSTADVTMLKRRAAEEGRGYQTLIASILHKYAAGGR